MSELDLFRKMLLIRRTAAQPVKSHQRGLIHGACHTYIGQEAIAGIACKPCRLMATWVGPERRLTAA